MIRHFFAILFLPFVAVVVVPLLLVRFGEGSEADPIGWWTAVGVVIGLCGSVLFVRCVMLFARRGRGTLAPWDPPRELVVEGPYRYMRNPMIAGVLLMLVGMAFFLRSWWIGSWAGLFFAINNLYFLFMEEPGLLQRFGERYARYKARTPLWWPRWTGIPSRKSPH